MMIAHARDNEGVPVLLLGLSRENIERLMAGEPIRISRKTHGHLAPDGITIGIIFGETEEAMRQMLKAKQGTTTQPTRGPDDDKK